MLLEMHGLRVGRRRLQLQYESVGLLRHQRSLQQPDKRHLSCPAATAVARCSILAVGDKSSCSIFAPGDNRGFD